VNIKNYTMDINNYIIAEIEIKEEDINKKIQIINSFEDTKRIHEWEDKKDDDEYENEKEIKENCEIKINNNIMSFSYYYEFKKKGKYKIEYTFNDKLSKTCYMFNDCSSLKYIDLSNFNVQNVKNMRCMFSNCSSLTKINLSNFNAQNITNMGFFFCGCKSLNNINLSNFNVQKVTNLYNMFKNCSSFINIKL